LLQPTCSPKQNIFYDRLATPAYAEPLAIAEVFVALMLKNFIKSSSIKKEQRQIVPVP